MSKMPVRPWSRRDVVALERWARSGLPAIEIAMRLGRTLPAVKTAIAARGIDGEEPLGWSRRQEQQLARWWKAGVPTKTISERLVRRPGVVLSKAKSLGLRRPDRSPVKPPKSPARSCLACGIKIPTPIPCHRRNCKSVAVGLAPVGREVRTKLSLVSSSMADG